MPFSAWRWIKRRQVYAIMLYPSSTAAFRPADGASCFSSPCSGRLFLGLLWKKRSSHSYWSHTPPSLLAYSNIRRIEENHV
jgi:hypothetical protein